MLETVAAGTVCRRVHRSGDLADAFNWTAQPSVLRGGRFDSLDGTYGHLYLGDSPEAAIAETLCRDLPLDGAARLVPWSRVSGRLLTSVEMLADVTVVALHGPALSQLGQDHWLCRSDAGSYVLTRRWAAAIRSWAPAAAGFQYRARFDEDRFSVVLFADNTGAPAVRALGDSIPLDSGAGLVLLRSVLQRHNATLSHRRASRR